MIFLLLCRIIHFVSGTCLSFITISSMRPFLDKTYFVIYSKGDLDMVQFYLLYLTSITCKLFMIPRGTIKNIHDLVIMYITPLVSPHCYQNWKYFAQLISCGRLPFWISRSFSRWYVLLYSYFCKFIYEENQFVLHFNVK